MKHDHHENEKDAGGIDLRGVHARYGRRPVLNGVTLRVPEGCTTVLLGGNGEGKSTLLRVALGVMKPTEGTVRVAGFDPLKQGRALRRAVGYVPDQPDVYAWMTLVDLLAFLAPHYPRWDGARALDIAERLEAPLKTRFKHMSRGQGMKAMLAASLGSDPDVLLLDEPFGGLDPLVREEVLASVIGALGDRPRTVLLATHDLDVAARVADRIALLEGGTIRREGPAAEIAGREESATPAALKAAMAKVQV